MYKVTDLVINEKARDWCRLSYPGHPKGCPNYGKQDRCPPKAPLIRDFIDLAESCWLIVSEFDVGEFEKKMLDKHPNWSGRQARCCLYWQRRARKELELETKRFSEKNKLIYTMTPEAMGVHVISTLKGLGVPIKVKPEDTIYLVSLTGHSNSRGIME